MGNLDRVWDNGTFVLLTNRGKGCMLYNMATLTRCNPEDLISISQAAKLLRVSRPTIYAMLRRGELVPVKISDRQYLVKSDVEELKQRRSGKSL